MSDEPTFPDASQGPAGQAPDATPNDAGGRPKKRRGRPPGSVSLTPEIQERILELIRGGTYDYIAAEAVGISERTFHEWIQRGEGKHPTRPATRRLKVFATEVRRAKAEARVAAEIRVYRDDASRWLSYQGRTKPGREGWTHPPETQVSSDAGRELEALILALEDEEPAGDPGGGFGPDRPDEATHEAPDGTEEPR